jgi:hypothetical protein
MVKVYLMNDFGREKLLIPVSRNKRYAVFCCDDGMRFEAEFESLPSGCEISPHEVSYSHYMQFIGRYSAHARKNREAAEAEDAMANAASKIRARLKK